MSANTATTEHNGEPQAPIYLGAGCSASDLEKGRPGHIERMITPGGHPVDFSQPAIPIQHRKYGNPIPIGLICFSMGFLMVGLYSLGVRGIKIPLVVLPPLMLFTGITQTLVGWFEMFIGNTFSATIFIAYGGFCFGYAGIYLPAFGLLEFYKNAETGLTDPSFDQAVGIYHAMWAIISFLFVIAALRSSGAVLAVLIWTTCCFICLAINCMAPSAAALKAQGAFCVIDAIFGFYAAMTGYWTPDTTFRWIRLNPVDLSPKDD